MKVYAFHPGPLGKLILIRKNWFPAAMPVAAHLNFAHWDLFESCCSEDANSPDWQVDLRCLFTRTCI